MCVHCVAAITSEATGTYLCTEVSAHPEAHPPHPQATTAAPFPSSSAGAWRLCYIRSLDLGTVPCRHDPDETTREGSSRKTGMKREDGDR